MAQFLGFGDGSDGILDVTSNTTDAPIDASCSGSSGTTSLSATNASFSADQIIFIHQSRGTDAAPAGAWEINAIASYVSGTITTKFNLANDYVDSGDQQAQVIVMKQYSGIICEDGFTRSAKAWDGDVGGIMAYLVSGSVSVTNGSLSINAKGYRGGASIGNQAQAFCGEGNKGASAQTTTAQGNGHGGTNSNGHGGGGGAGSSGVAAKGGGAAAAEGGTADLTTMVFGGGASSGWEQSSGATASGKGGNGGGMLLIHHGGKLTISGTGSIDGAGENGGNCNNASDHAGEGGGGGGGSVFLKGPEADIGTDLISVDAGSGSQHNGTGGADSFGTNGTAGYIRIESCQITGSTSPTPSESEGGFDFCATANQII